MQNITDIIDLLKSKSLTVSTAESCTGGLIAAAITNMSGASAIFDRGFVTYSNQAKQDMLGVPSEIIENHGAVSEQCAAAMAQGALKNSGSNIAISITGIAGPDGGSTEKPVGLVYIGIATKETTSVKKYNFKGSRDDVRQSTVVMAFNLLAKAASSI